MIHGTVRGQRLVISADPIVADTIAYVTAHFTFSKDWDGLEKYVHFKQDDTVYDLELIDDEIAADRNLDLTEGTWEVYLHGNLRSGETVTERITTSVESITIAESGVLNGEPFPSITPSAGEALLAKVQAAREGAEEAESEAKSAASTAAGQASVAASASISAMQSMESAGTFAGEAESSASAAAASAEEAQSSATAASQSAAAAQTAAGEAETAKTDAEAAKTDAAKSAETASTMAVSAQSYAVGGTGSREGEDTDNAKYYKEQAQSILSSKMDKENPTGTGSFSLNRKADTTVGDYSVAEGYSTTAGGRGSHAEGSGTTASGTSSHAEGGVTTASGMVSHTEGDGTTASGYGSHSEGQLTTASGDSSHAEGGMTTASGDSSHAEGAWTEAQGGRSHAEGYRTKSQGIRSHAEGNLTTASGDSSHAEGGGTTASGSASHSEGIECSASGVCSHAEGENSIANGEDSHAEGRYTITNALGQHAQGKYNVEDTGGVYADIVGGGSSDTERKNISALDWNGNLKLAGNVYIGANDDSTGGTLLALRTEAGNSLELSMDSSTFVLTATLKDKDGSTLSTQTVDLPLETMVVSASYDKDTKEIVLTLQSGQTVRFSVADLVSGLVSDETFNAHANDTDIHITAEERSKWNAKQDKDTALNTSSDAQTKAGQLNVSTTAGNGIVMGGAEYTKYTGMQAVRKPPQDGGNVDTAGFIINGDGTSKFLHRRGDTGAGEDAYFAFDALGYKMYASGTKGNTDIPNEPTFSALQANERPQFKGKDLALYGDVESKQDKLTDTDKQAIADLHKDAVESVNGKTGAVELTSTDIKHTEGETETTVGAKLDELNQGLAGLAEWANALGLSVVDGAICVTYTEEE